MHTHAHTTVIINRCSPPPPCEGFIEVDGTTRNLVIQPPSDGAVDVRGNVTISGTLTNAALVRALFTKPTLELSKQNTTA